MYEDHPVPSPETEGSPATPVPVTHTAETCGVTATKRMFVPPWDESKADLCVHLTHEASGVVGIVFRPWDTVPSIVQRNIADDHWDHPLLQEMRREAMTILLERAREASKLLGAA